MKKVLAKVVGGILALASVFSFAACNDNGGDKPTITVG